MRPRGKSGVRPKGGGQGQAEREEGACEGTVCDCLGDMG